jgi:hypothetical protein
MDAQVLLALDIKEGKQERERFREMMVNLFTRMQVCFWCFLYHV